MSESADYYLPPDPPSPPATLASRRTFKNAIQLIVPPWLMQPVGGAILQACAEQLDDLVDRVRAAVKLRFPGLYSFDSLPELGRQRRIRRGRFETDATYAGRLIPWLDAHRHRGGPYAMLGQLFAFYGPSNFQIVLLYTSGRQFTMDVDGAIVMDDAGTWDIGGPAAQWARYLLIFDWPNPVDDDGTWNDAGTWDDGGVWDSDLSPDDVRDIRMIPREWQPARALGRVRLVSPLETVEFSVE